MESQPTVLLRAGDGIEAGEAANALEAVGFRVLVAGSGGTDPADGPPDLEIRHFTAVVHHPNGAGGVRTAPTVPVLSLDLSLLDAQAVAEVALRVVGPRRGRRRWLV